jgi:hypothetical protein
MTPRGNILLTKVADLIDPITGTWDEKLARENFFTVDVNRILSIPLSNHGMEDFVAWRHNKNSLFFLIRSAYHVEWKHQFGDKERNLQAPGRPRISDVSDILWKSSVTAKIKIFSWKSLHGIFPCYGVLENRHIPISGQCPWCSIHSEDIKHVLFECEHAAVVWSKLGILSPIQNVLHVY